MMLKILMALLFLLVVAYNIFVFVQLLVNMKQPVVLPLTKEDMASIRKQPATSLNAPVYARQKTGIILHIGIVFLVGALYVLGTYFNFIEWPQFLLLLVILWQSNLHSLFNMFAVTESGLLSGDRFMAWKRIKSFQFIPIDINHRYYGHAKDVNDAYELKIKTFFFTTSCVVLSEEMKERLQQILSERIKKSHEYVEW